MPFIQIEMVHNSCTHIQTLQSNRIKVKHSAISFCLTQEECMCPTCVSSVGTSSYVLESVEVLLEEVAHLRPEKKGEEIL